MPSQTDLSAVLVSRICHDLVSPIGAVVNGIDLVREIGTGDTEAELAMISQSSDRASALLQFYRIAFGAASEDSEISRSALRDQATEFIGSPRIIVSWPQDNGPALTRPCARLLFQLMMCARGLSAMRGIIDVSLPPQETVPLEIVVQSEGGPDSAEMLGYLDGSRDPSAVSPRLVEFVLAPQYAQAMGLVLSISQDAGKITMRVADA